MSSSFPFKVLFCMLAWAPLSFASEPSFVISAGASYSLLEDGYVRVREWEVAGDRLDLDDELGLSSALGLEFGFGIRLGAGWFDIAHTEYRYRGTANFASTFEFNGAIYAAGSTDIGRTRHRRTALIYNKTLLGERTSETYTSLGGGILLETLNFYIDGDLDATTTRDEKYESFARQLVPIPVIQFRYYRPLTGIYRYGFDVMAAYMPKIKTHYSEGGSIYFSQYNLDLKAEVIMPFRGVDIGAGYQFKVFNQVEESREDTNEFKIMTSSLALNAKYFF